MFGIHGYVMCISRTHLMMPKNEDIIQLIHTLERKNTW